MFVVAGVGKPVDVRDGGRMVHVYLEDSNTPVKEGAAYTDLVVFRSESRPQLFDTAVSLKCGQSVVPYRNGNGYLEDIIVLS